MMPALAFNEFHICILNDYNSIELWNFNWLCEQIEETEAANILFYKILVLN